MKVIYQQAKDVLFDTDDAILNEEYDGFKLDYLVLHSLLRYHQPKSILEIGTNMGVGTNIICNAIPDAEVYSLDLPTELAHISLQHPISEGKGDKVGSLCTRPYTQLRGDSLEYQYFPVEAAFIDGEHDWQHPWHETLELSRGGVKLFVWHDADIAVVWEGITQAIRETREIYWNPYQLYRVEDTRIAYALKTEAE